MSKPKSKKPAMSVAEAEEKNPGGGNFIRAAEQKRAAHEAFVAEVLQQLDLYDKLEELRALPIDDKKPFLMQLNFAGLSLNDASKILGIGIATASRWFKDQPEQMQQLVRSTLATESLKEVGPTWARLQSLRYSGNAETSRKAALDCLAVAGLGVHGPAGVTVNVNARNAQFSVLPVGDIEEKLKELARIVGPAAEKIVDAEIFTVRDLHGNGQPRKTEAPTTLPAGGAVADPGPAGGTAPQESQPAD